MITVTGLLVFAIEIVASRLRDSVHFWAILVALLNIAPPPTDYAIAANAFCFLAYRLFTWLLFGRLSQNELHHLKEHRWPVLLQLMGLFAVFKESMALESFLNFMSLYYLTLACVLFTKRIDELLDQNVHLFWHHFRTLLALIVLSTLNIIGIIYHWTDLHYQSGRYNLYAYVNVHCFVAASVPLTNSFAMYIVNVIERSWLEEEWEHSELFESLLTVLFEAILFGSHTFIIFLMIFTIQFDPNICLVFCKSLVRFNKSIRNLFVTYRTVKMIANFPVPTQLQVDQQDRCTICLDTITPRSDNRRAINCTHIFHYRCLKKWAISNQGCPSCRASF